MTSMSSSGSSLTIQGTKSRALFVAVISFYITQSAAITDVYNSTLLNQPGVVGVWRWNGKDKYRPPSDFRDETARNFYNLWPEDNDDYPFRFPCEDRKSRLMLSNFTYSMNEGLVQSLLYHDLGIVDQYRPYWRRPTTSCFGCATNLVGYPAIYCERGDLTYLYYYRAKKTVFQGVIFGVIMVVVLQIAFVTICLVIPFYLLHRSRSEGQTRVVARSTAKHLKDLTWGGTCVEYLHLITLGAAGYLLVEGFGHSDPHNWRASIMNTLAYYYRVQTACAFVSSFLRQCANSMKLISDGEGFKTSSHDKHRETLIGQVVVCIIMVEYLYLTDELYMEFMIQVVLGVVTVAVTFSMSVVIFVGGKSLRYIVKTLLNKKKSQVAFTMGHDPAAGSQTSPSNSAPSPAPDPVAGCPQTPPSNSTTSPAPDPSAAFPQIPPRSSTTSPAPDPAAGCPKAQLGVSTPSPPDP